MRQAVCADAINFHFMLKHVKPIGGGDILLEAFQVIVSEFRDVSAPCADHMIMMLAKVSMLIANLPVFEGSFLGEPETAHHFQGLVNELIGKVDTVFGQELVHFLERNVLFSLEKHLEDLKTIFKPIDVRLKKEPFEMLLFFSMYWLHCVVFSRRARGYRRWCSCHRCRFSSGL